MVIQKTPTKIDKIVSLKIGQRGENLATDIKMDVSDWVAIHPDAHYHCLFKRPGEVQVLPVLSSFEDGILTWTVRAWECGVIGVGYLEVMAVDSDTGMVAKSRVIPCSVEDSIIDDEGPVPPEMSWVEEVIEAKNDAEAARDEAQEVVAGAIDGIEAAGEVQVGAVNSAGATQVGAVRDKGEEVLDSIPDDYSALSGEVSDLKSAIEQIDGELINGYTEISKSNFVSGIWHNTDGIMPNNYAWVAGPFEVKAGDTLSFDSGSLYANIVLASDSKTLIKNIAGIYQEFVLVSDENYSIDTDGLIFISVRNGAAHASSSAITQDNITASGTIDNLLAGKLASKVDDLWANNFLTYPYDYIPTSKAMWRSNGEISGSVRFVCSADFIPKTIRSFTVGAAFKAQVLIYSGTTITRSYWYGKDTSLSPLLGDTYVFDHDNYKYKINVAYSDERVYTDAEYEALLSTGVTFSVRTLELVEQNDIYASKLIDLVKRGGNIRYANAISPVQFTNHVYSENGDDPVHPKVLFFSTAWNGHKYWMAYTPYINSQTEYENPCIAYSDDGIVWTNIENNPLATGTTANYYSDTDLIYRQDLNRLECWYRQVIGTSSEIIYRQTSTDGLTWSAQELIYQSDAGTAKLLSPAVIYQNDKYKIWVVTNVDGGAIDYYESTDGTAWQKLASTIKLDFACLGHTYTPWHIDVTYIGSEFVMIMMCKGNIWPLFIAYSSDGVNWNTPVPVILPNKAGWDTRMYRSCIVKTSADYRIYYSTRNTSTTDKQNIGVSISVSGEPDTFIGYGVI